MYARSSTIHARPSAIDAGITYIHDKVWPGLSGLDGYVRVWSTSGRPLATADLGASPIFGSPALGDVSGDGVADVTVGNAANTIATFSFRGGQVRESKAHQHRRRHRDGGAEAGSALEEGAE